MALSLNAPRIRYDLASGARVTVANDGGGFALHGLPWNCWAKQIPTTSISWHMKEMSKKRILVQLDNRGPYRLASADHRAAKAPQDIKAVTTMNRAVPQLDLFNKRHLESILLRIENVNALIEAPIFTEFDIQFLRKLAR